MKKLVNFSKMLSICVISLLSNFQPISGAVAPFNDGDYVTIKALWNKQFIKSGDNALGAGRKGYAQAISSTFVKENVFKIRKYPNGYIGLESLVEPSKFISKSVANVYILPFAQDFSLFKFFSLETDGCYALQNKENQQFAGKHSDQNPSVIKSTYPQLDPSNPNNTSFEIKKLTNTQINSLKISIPQPFNDGDLVYIKALWNNHFIMPKKDVMPSHLGPGCVLAMGTWPLVKENIFKIKKYLDGYISLELLTEPTKFISHNESNVRLLPFTDETSLFKVFSLTTPDSYVLQNKVNQQFVGKYSAGLPAVIKSTYPQLDPNNPNNTSFEIKKLTDTQKQSLGIAIIATPFETIATPFASGDKVKIKISGTENYLTPGPITGTATASYPYFATLSDSPSQTFQVQRENNTSNYYRFLATFDGNYALDKNNLAITIPSGSTQSTPYILKELAFWNEANKFYLISIPTKINTYYLKAERDQKYLGQDSTGKLASGLEQNQATEFEITKTEEVTSSPPTVIPFNDGDLVYIKALWNKQFIKSGDNALGAGRKGYAQAISSTLVKENVFKIKKYRDGYIGLESLVEPSKFISKSVANVYILPFAQDFSLFKVFSLTTPDSYALQNKVNQQFVGKYSAGLPAVIKSTYPQLDPSNPNNTSFEIKKLTNTQINSLKISIPQPFNDGDLVYIKALWNYNFFIPKTDTPERFGTNYVQANCLTLLKTNIFKIKKYLDGYISLESLTEPNQFISHNEKNVRLLPFSLDASLFKVFSLTPHGIYALQNKKSQQFVGKFSAGFPAVIRSTYTTQDQTTPENTSFEIKKIAMELATALKLTTVAPTMAQTTPFSDGDLVYIKALWNYNFFIPKTDTPERFGTNYVQANCLTLLKENIFKIKKYLDGYISLESLTVPSTFISHNEKNVRLLPFSPDASLFKVSSLTPRGIYALQNKKSQQFVGKFSVGFPAVIKSTYAQQNQTTPENTSFEIKKIAMELATVATTIPFTDGMLVSIKSQKSNNYIFWPSPGKNNYARHTDASTTITSPVTIFRIRIYSDGSFGFESVAAAGALNAYSSFAKIVARENIYKENNNNFKFKLKKINNVYTIQNVANNKFLGVPKSSSYVTYLSCRYTTPETLYTSFEITPISSELAASFVLPDVSALTTPADVSALTTKVQTLEKLIATLQIQITQLQQAAAATAAPVATAATAATAQIRRAERPYARIGIPRKARPDVRPGMPSAEQDTTRKRFSR